jgi:hypothetical protein
MLSNKIDKFAAKKELYKVFLDKLPREELIRKSLSDLEDNEFTELQDFVGNHQKVCNWSTNIGLMEAIEHIVDDARGNDNINE